MVYLDCLVNLVIMVIPGHPDKTASDNLESEVLMAYLVATDFLAYPD